MVTVVCCTKRDYFIENVFRNYESQSIKKKELIIILNRDEMDVSKWKRRAKAAHNVSVYQLMKDTTLGECLNYGINRAQYGIIAKMDDDDYYAPSYLAQQVKALQEKKADIVCKTTVFMYFEPKQTLALHLADWGINHFVNKAGGVKGSTLVFKKDIWRKVHFPRLNLNEDHTFLKNCMKKKMTVYVTDQYNYVCIRRFEKLHTWQVNNYLLMQESKILCKTKDYKNHAQNNRKK